MSEFERLEAGMVRAYGTPAASPDASVLARILRDGAAVRRVVLEDESGELDAPLGMLSSEARQRVEGRYQVLGEIARGGVGVILKGHDVDLGRDVAMKVLREEHLDRPDALQRFVEEAQIGGQLQHPGIVPVYELGLRADRRPFFTMKLVRGRTLSALLRERGEPSSDRRRHLAIFEAVCQTMAYAHSRGVVHRDLKPANVMVGSFGEVLVVDWGMGKVLRSSSSEQTGPRPSGDASIRTVRTGSGSSHSVAGSLMGTPAYMPPEQARGEVERLDERSDVFALGAILCEILTGKPPYPGDASEAMDRAARADLEDAEGRLERSDADADLVRIARSCLSPDPEARPRDARAVASRIAEHLESVEERARAAQLEAARAQAQAKAERKSRRLQSVLSIVVLAGIGTFLWLARGREIERRETESTVLAALGEAEGARARGSFDQALAEAARARALAQGRSSTDGLRLRAERDYERIAAEAEVSRRKAALDRDNAAILAELESVGEAEHRDGEYATDWAALDESYRRVFERHGLHPDRGGEEEAVASLESRGIGADLAAAIDAWSFGRSFVDEVGADRLTRIADRIDPDPLRHRLREAITDHDAAAIRSVAGEIRSEEQPSQTLHLLGLGLSSTGALTEAVEVLRRARSVYPGNFVLAMDLGRRCLNLEPRREEEAARHFGAALSLRPDSIEAWHELGRVLGSQAEKVRHFESALLRLGRDAHLEYHLGLALEEEGRYEESEVHLRRSLEIEPDHYLAHNQLGAVFLAQERFDEAMAEFRIAIELEPGLAGPRANLAATLGAAGRHAEALAEFRRAVASRGRSFEAYHGLGIELFKAGSLEEASEAFRRATELDPESALASHNLAGTLHRLGRRGPAIEAYRRAIALAPSYGEAHCQLGVALYQEDRLDEAVAAWRRAVEVEPYQPQALAALARGLSVRESGGSRDKEEALIHAERAVEVAGHDAGCWDALGMALYVNDRLAEATDAFERAIDIHGESATRCLYLAMCRQRTGEPEDAKSQLASADREIEPLLEGDPPLRRFRERARREILGDAAR